MKQRSPVLGYNHNVRYAGRLWHVQTEDSGVQAPHIFTHLFCDGTILATKKVDYDATMEVSSVQRLMQSQHKHMLKELKGGSFDKKIEQYFGPIPKGKTPDESSDVIEMVADHTGEFPLLTAEQAAPSAEDARSTRPTLTDLPVTTVQRVKKTSEDDKTTVPNLAPLLPPPAAQPPVAEQPRAAAPIVSSGERKKRPTLNPARPAVTVTTRSGTHPSPPPTIGGRAAARAAAPVPRSAPPTIGSSRSGTSGTGTGHRAEGVVVARPAVIVGKDAGNRSGAADFWKTEPARAQPEPTFGENLISEKSLDEVILAYLSEDAPKK
jgi:hypothetical protein